MKREWKFLSFRKVAMPIPCSTTAPKHAEPFDKRFPPASTSMRPKSLKDGGGDDA